MSPGRELFGVFLILCGFLLAASGVMALGYQVFEFLQTGVWPALSVIDVGRYLSPGGWFDHPADWLGVHFLLSKCSASWAVIFAGINLCIVGAVVAD